MSVIQKNNKKEKIVYIEILRIVACFAVILLHTITAGTNAFTNMALYGTNTWKISVLINSTTRFAVPIFLMISGYLALNSTKEESLSKYLKSKFFRLVVPLISYSLFYYTVDCISNKSAFSIFEFLFKFITMDIHYHLWFMYTLISIELFTPLLKIIIKNADRKKLWYFFFIIILPATILTAINRLIDTWLFRFEPVVLGYVGYYILGYLLGTADISKNKRIAIYILGLFAITISYFGTIHLSSNEYIEGFFNGGYQFNSYLIATALFVFAKYNIKSFKINYIQNMVIELGSLTYGIYLIHAFVLEYLKGMNISGHVLSLISLSIPTYIISAIIVLCLKKISGYSKKLIQTIKF